MRAVACAAGDATLIEKQLAIDIPPMMEAIIYCFIYAAEILGEINFVLYHHSRMGHHACTR